MRSASLIRRGVVVTAAHCVANFGQQQFYSGWQFVPGYHNGIAPFGVWSVRQAIVLTSYLDGTDPCAVAGIVYQDDVALLLLNTSSTGDYPGTATGWYGYGWDNFGFTTIGLTQITQIGYPVCLDSGFLMERNDSFGFQSVSSANNTIIGSLMCGGASGGPWLVNFGLRPVLTSTTEGTAPNPNTVIGVTSWGFIPIRFSNPDLLSSILTRWSRWALSPVRLRTMSKVIRVKPPLTRAAIDARLKPRHAVWRLRRWMVIRHAVGEPAPAQDSACRLGVSVLTVRARLAA